MNTIEEAVKVVKEELSNEGKLNSEIIDNIISETKRPSRILSKVLEKSQNTSEEFKEIQAEISIPFSVFQEDKDQIKNFLCDMIGSRLFLDLEELLILGDENSEDRYLALFDGIINKSVEGSIPKNSYIIATPDLWLDNKNKCDAPCHHSNPGPYENFFIGITDLDKIKLYVSDDINIKVCSDTIVNDKKEKEEAVRLSIFMEINIDIKSDIFMSKYLTNK